MFFSYDPLDGVFEFHETAAEAEAECRKIVDHHREVAGDSGWDENAGDVCWGEIRQRLTETSRRPVNDDDPVFSGFDDIAEMELLPEVASEHQQFPTMWGVYMTSCFRSRLYDTEQEAIERAAEMPMATTVVRLIPEPEVDRLVRDAEQRGRDAERERCRKIAEAQRLLATPSSARSDTVDMWASRTTAECIGMAIELGEQPGEGANS